MFSSRKRSRNSSHEIDPDEIFLDSSNLPDFNVEQFEGRIEKAIPRRNVYIIGAFFAIISILFAGKIFMVQIFHGKMYANISQNNALQHTLMFAERGVIYDRFGTPLAWNEVNPTSTDYALRMYTDDSGLSNLLGYVSYPAKDTSGFYYNDKFTGNDGIEKFYNSSLTGENGLKITETDAVGKVLSESTIRPPVKGDNIMLSIDERLQHAMYQSVANTAQTSGFVGGAGVLMNVHTGEVLAAVSYPEYNSNVMTQHIDNEKIKTYLSDKSNPFLDRVTTGLYTPGSIVKPIFALAALNEGVIDANKKILSTGSISVPNPYKPGSFAVFKDWRANGWTDVREAIAVSSDVYFYEIGGGYQGQKGLGVTNLDKYASMFGLGSSTEGTFFSGKKGTVPTVDWKALTFPNDPTWRLGDTYNTSIGQYGFQVTPIQMVRAVSAIANNGHLITPTIISQTSASSSLTSTLNIVTDIASSTPNIVDLPHISSDLYEIVREGMRMAVTTGTLQAVSVPGVEIAAKSGTAELGTQKLYINSWIVGFWPYKSPDYAFAVLLEHGPAHYALGAPAAMRSFVDWLNTNAPEYVK